MNDIQRSLFKDCVRKTRTLAGHFNHETRACQALRQLARTLPLLLLTHSKMEIRAACNKFLKGEWESLWNKCMAKGHARQDKLAANPLSASSRTCAHIHMYLYICIYIYVYTHTYIYVVYIHIYIYLLYTYIFIHSKHRKSDKGLRVNFCEISQQMELSTKRRWISSSLKSEIEHLLRVRAK